MVIADWVSNNWIEIFGAVTGIIYVFLEIRQHLWLWPVGVFTSAVYIWVFFTGKFYADMSLQVYYLIISFLGWHWWLKGIRRKAQDTRRRVANENSPFEGGERDVQLTVNSAVDAQTSELIANNTRQELPVTRIKLKLAAVLFIVFLILYILIYLGLREFTDSPVPHWDSFITSLSIIATWMLARKIYEHWFLWIVVNSVSCVIFTVKGLYPTVILYAVYCIMSFAGLYAWKRTLADG
jgi:nicotinamide mononucleotide transporter